MHIVVLCEDFYPTVSGGAHVRWHFSRIAAEEHDITVFTPKTPDTKREETVQDIHIVRPFKAELSTFPSYSVLSILTRIFYSILITIYLFYWMRGQDVDGVHSTDHSLHWSGAVVSKLFGIPHVSFVGYSPSIHSVSVMNPKYLLEQLNFYLFMGDYAFCRTPSVKSSIFKAGTPADIVHGILDQRSITDIPDVVNRHELRKSYDVQDTTKLFIFVGRLTPLKRVHICVDIIQQLEGDHKLLIVGDGPERDDIEQDVLNKGLESNVHFTGYLPHQEALQLMAVADALLLTSEAESYSAVALEALSLDTAVFATPVGVLTEIEHRNLSVGDPQELHQSITDANFSSDIDLDQDTLERFSMERYTETILDKFENLT